MPNVRTIAGIASIMALLAAASCAPFALPSGATSQSQALHLDWTVFTLAGALVAVTVLSLILLPVLIWRRRDEAYPPQFRRNNRLEIGYTIGPLVMIAGLFALTYRNETIVEREVAHPQYTVDVVAFKWSWQFHYEGSNAKVLGTPQAPPQLLLPVDETTRINLTSNDVNHAFWIPAFLFKRDAIAGITNSFDLRPTREGLYDGRCAEFCGLQHARMSFTVLVVSRSDYDRRIRGMRMQ